MSGSRVDTDVFSENRGGVVDVVDVGENGSRGRNSSVAEISWRVSLPSPFLYCQVPYIEVPFFFFNTLDLFPSPSGSPLLLEDC